MAEVPEGVRRERKGDPGEHFCYSPEICKQDNCEPPLIFSDREVEEESLLLRNLEGLEILNLDQGDTSP